MAQITENQKAQVKKEMTQSLLTDLDGCISCIDYDLDEMRE